MTKVFQQNDAALECAAQLLAFSRQPHCKVLTERMWVRPR